MVDIRFTQNIQRHVECAERAVDGATVREALDAYFEGNPAAKSYIVDDQGFDHGRIANGWSLQLTTLVGVNSQVMMNLGLNSNGMQQGGPLQVNIAGRVGVTYVIEVSSDLQTWTPVSTNTTMNGQVSYQDREAASKAQRFYRATER